MSPSSLIRHNSTWAFDSKLPADWAELVHRLGGGFFHTPLGLRTCATEGEAVFARLIQDNEVVGIALGARVRCRLGGMFGHLYFPTRPAFTDPEMVQGGMARLAMALREWAVAEVWWDGLDLDPVVHHIPRPVRQEYLLDLQEPRDGIADGRGAGWALTQLEGPAAEAALARVVAAPRPRNALRTPGASPALLQLVAEARSHSPFWGLTTFAVTNDGELLGAALVGRAGRRAYSLFSGATPAGSLLGAPAWLQARLIGLLAEAGCTRYTLGHAPLTAADPTDPAHEVHRSHCGLGARPVPCGGEQWILLAHHMRGHQLFRATS